MSFFAAPPTIQTAVFTRLPDRYRQPKRTAWADANRQGRAIDSFLEGPSFDRQGNLYVTDIPNGRIFRIDPQGEWELVCEYDGADGDVVQADLVVKTVTNGLTREASGSPARITFTMQAD